MKIIATVLLLIGLIFSISNGKSLEPVLSGNNRPCLTGEGVTVINGIISWRPDPCTHCTCNNGVTHCTVQHCAPPPCDDYVVPEGKCCPVCSVVEDDCSSEFNLGWKPADPCTFCSCVNGKPRCLVRDCAAPSCSNYVTPPGQCCPICTNGPDLLH